MSCVGKTIHLLFNFIGFFCEIKNTKYILYKNVIIHGLVNWKGVLYNKKRLKCGQTWILLI